MKYMLVLQFPEEIFTYDDLIEQENKLINGLKGVAVIDGHDIGAGEINIFIVTENPNEVFEKTQPLLKAEAMTALKAAYRNVDGDEYHIIYPLGLREFTIL